MKKFVIRSARKSAHLSTKALHKALNVTTRVEDKATRILTGVDSTYRIQEDTPIEKVLFHYLPLITPLNPAMPPVGSVPSVVLLIPSLDNKSFYGGTATAIIIAAKMAIRTGRPLHIVQTTKPGTREPLAPLFHRYGIKLDADTVKLSDVSSRTDTIYGYIPMHADDIFIASAWWDARVIQALPRAGKFVYLIQDFEPIFYENSDRYALAEETYRTEDFVPLCNTKLMFDFMTEQGYPAMKDGVWFEPAAGLADKPGSSNKKAAGKKKLFFYGRPNVARNLFHIGLLSLDKAIASGKLNPNEWEMYMAGQDNIADIKLSSGATIKNLGKMSMDDYTAFTRGVDVAVSLMMAPHPNYPTLEFASTGASVVTTAYKNKQDLSNYSRNIFVANTTVDSIAEAIEKACAMDREARQANMKYNNILTDWDTSLDDPIDATLKKLGVTAAVGKVKS